ncbi:MAG: hypothetical protein KatS3mg068_1176 [Candidatus Sericytochromatia bacterium]|nr:MAG: hypothetical protein KatS3mg068_1176 [Candidatus Sericytochromatia bacterium]
MEEIGNRIYRLLKNISLNSINGIEKEFDKLVSIFQDNKIKVHIPELLNKTIPSKDFCRILNVYEEEKNVKHSIFLCYGHLDDEKISLVLNSFSQFNDKNKLYFISDYPLPDILKFFTSNHLVSFFEYECIKYSKNMENIISDNTLIEYYSNKFIEIFNLFFNEKLNYTNVYPSLKSFENNLVKNIRDCHEYHYLFDDEFDYFPKYILNLSGVYVTQLMIKNFDTDIYFPDDSKDIEDLLLTIHGKKEDIYVFPVRKLSEFFYGGKNESVINWFYQIKYQYNLDT